ncbi:MAG: UDP-glucose/GDP-mannose dehydrogenase family protein [Chitinophagaceae bacterium]|nr:UDP-glucose/GDP-mannose dehydrogenase family protein [Chitinophagaceae bacterium]
MKIAVVGTGYVGLVSGTCFAETGNHVTCIDIDEAKISKLEAGEVTIYEPGLEKIFTRNIKDGRLKFTTSLAEGIKDAALIFLALPTPPGEDGSADLKYILAVAADLGKLLMPGDYKVIVDKSTVPVGTCDKVKEAILKSGGNELAASFDVVSNPEFLREGAAVDDFMKPDRVVIGTSSEKAKKIMQRLYEPFVRQGNPIIFMDEKSAELTKYAANSFLATKISFMNEIAILCEKMGANVDMVRRGIGTDFRIGKHFLYPGLGYGGSCFPKDVQALARSSSGVAYDFKILNAVMEVNRLQKEFFVSKISNYFANSLAGKKIALWGLAFKPNTDDIREAPALFVIDYLLNNGASVTVFDPEAMPNVKTVYGDKVSFAASQYDALKEAEALVICTEWNEFRTPDFELIASQLKSKVIFDGRNLYDVEAMQQLGFHYESVGRLGSADTNN